MNSLVETFVKDDFIKYSYKDIIIHDDNTKCKELKSLQLYLFIKELSIYQDNYNVNAESLYLYIISQNDKFNPSYLKEIFVKNYKNSIGFEVESKMNYRNLVNFSTSSVYEINDGYFNIKVKKQKKHKKSLLLFIFSNEKDSLLNISVNITNNDFFKEENFYLLSLLLIQPFINKHTLKNEEHSFIITESKKITKNILEVLK